MTIVYLAAFAVGAIALLTALLWTDIGHDGMALPYLTGTSAPWSPNSYPLPTE